MGDFLRAEVAAGRKYLPAGANVLRAFQQPFADVRVLVMGQDPYPTPGHAVGLSFSVAPDVRPLPQEPAEHLPRVRERPRASRRPPPATSRRGRRAGVLLLNRVLTVEPGAPGSHRAKGWEKVTEAAVQALVLRPDQPLVAVLWGRDAQTVKPLLGEEVPTVESAHPSPMSADRGFFGSKPFSRVDEYLTELGDDPLDWRLP